VRCAGKTVCLGSFATAEEAALCAARSPERQEAAKRAAAAPLLTSEEVRQQARAEGLTLLVAGNKAGYYGVYHHPGKPRPYAAQVRRGGKDVRLGMFATAEEAALCVARTPEGQEAAKRAAAAPPLTSEEARQQGRAEDVVVVEVEVLEAEEVVEEEEENVQMVEVVAAMEPEVVVDEGGRSKGRVKRRRNI
jgi:hypothetical protein